MPYVGRVPTPSPVTTDDIPANSIDASKIIDGSITLADLGTLNDVSLEAYNNTSAITGNAVDVFIYDTSNDSDGGAWRKRTQATSWYNETLNTATRGSRKEFPSVAVIVAEASKVTIYDGDTPDLDMWMVFDGGNDSDMIYNISNSSLSAIKMLDGLLSTTGTGLNRISFITDTGFYTNATSTYKYKGSIDERNDALSVAIYDSALKLVNSTVNDIAMTVLPNAPIDSTTGLPIPTIACLVGESLVTLSNGTNKRIDEVEIGEVVKTLEGEHTVTNWFDQGVKEVIELEFDGGQRLTCTADHRIRTTDGWVEAGNLTDSDEVVGL